MPNAPASTRKLRPHRGTRTLSKPAARSGDDRTLLTPRTHGPSVLILECDAEKLTRQRITFAAEVAELVKALVAGVRAVHVKATTRARLVRHLAKATEEFGRFDVVLIIGHSNTDGLKLTADYGPSWNEVAKWLAPFAPRTLFLVACQAGRWLPSRALFHGIGSLQMIYGSPIVTTPEHASAIKVLLPYILHGGRLAEDLRPLAQVANFALTGGFLFQQTREAFTNTGAEDGVLWTLAEEALEQLAPDLREIFKDAFR